MSRHPLTNSDMYVNSLKVKLVSEPVNRENCDLKKLRKSAGAPSEMMSQDRVSVLKSIQPNCRYSLSAVLIVQNWLEPQLFTLLSMSGQEQLLAISSLLSIQAGLLLPRHF